MRLASSGSRNHLRLGVLVLLLGIVLAPVAVSASHVFNDVPDDSTFHADIAWLADVGVTKGCNPPANDMYCPSENVTRGQMAAFLRRLAEAQVVDAATAIEAQHAVTADAAVAADHAVAADYAVDADYLGGHSSDQFQMMTGSVSCASSIWRPYSSETTWEMIASLLYRTGAGGYGFFRCSLDIPDGVTVTQVDYSVHDASASADIIRCEMWRTNLVTDIGFEGLMADAAATTGQPGPTVLSDTTIDYPVIDNDLYAYFVQCGLPEAGSNLGIYGVSVDYVSSVSPTPDARGPEEVVGGSKP